MQSIENIEHRCDRRVEGCIDVDMQTQELA